MRTTRHGTATFEYDDHSVTITRRFDAPRTLVFEALTRPEHISVWFPADDVALHVCEIDLRVGGSYRYAWYAPGAVECSFRGTFLEIERPDRIVSTWLFEGWPEDEAVETVTLAEESGITTMTDVLDFTSREHLGDHFRETDGAQASWDKLEDLLAVLQTGPGQGSESPS
ncbi:MAG TPA: SRPBCC domain-containing protein [Acidimicrobiales bacterium]|nr:SRPBCC domain-containing protein [Acidimicrobiales bacterium]